MKKIVRIVTDSLAGRNATADLLKGLAVIFMIAVHITELLLLPEHYETTAGSILLFLGGPPAAPVFMMMMGYYLAHSKKTPAKNLTRGIIIFLGGILLNILLNASLLYLIYFEELSYNPFHYIFGVDILALAGIGIIIISLLQLIKRNSIPLFALSAGIVIIISTLLPFNYVSENEFVRYLLAYVFTREFWSYFPLFPWLLYPLAGYTTALVLNKYLLSRKIIALTALLFIPFVIFTTPRIIEDITILYAYYHHGIKLALWILLFTIGYASIIYLIPEKAANIPLLIWVRWLGKYVTAAYVLQWVLLGNLGTWYYQSFGWGESFVLFIGALIFVSAGIYIWQEWNSGRNDIKKGSPAQ